jgi:hypothetical protein
MTNPQKPIPPEAFINTMDFTIDNFCDACPLRRPEYEGFEPAYGVVVDYDEKETVLDLISFEVVWEQARDRLAGKKPTYRARLNIGNVTAYQLEDAFAGCERPSRLERVFQKDRIVCTALNRVLPNLVPTTKNLSITPLDIGLHDKDGISTYNP